MPYPGGTRLVLVDEAGSFGALGPSDGADRRRPSETTPMAMTDHGGVGESEMAFILQDPTERLPMVFVSGLPEIVR